MQLSVDLTKYFTIQTLPPQNIYMTSIYTPLVTKDARFRAGLKLKRTGRVHLGSIKMFDTLLDKVEEDFGEDHLEFATVSYELGHALYLNFNSGHDEREKEIVLEDSLSLMAKAVQILYTHLETSKEDASQIVWIKEQLPRMLLGIGSVFSFMGKHAEGIDSFLNADPFRQEASDALKKENTIGSLRAKRLLVEVHVLIAGELLECDFSKDVIVEDTNHVIVKAKEIRGLAQNYYDQAKELFQDVVYMMANLGAIGNGDKSCLQSEKVDICHLATMLMEVGMSLAQSVDEDLELDGEMKSKKARTM